MLLIPILIKITRNTFTVKALQLVKDCGLLLGYSLGFMLLLGVVMYVMQTAVNGRLQSEIYRPEGLGDEILYKAAESIVLLAFFAKRRSIKLNYKRILNTNKATLIKAGKGFIASILALLFITAIMMAFNVVHLVYNPSYSLTQVGLYFLIFVLVGFNEEFLMRGIWLEYLLKRHSRVTAITISSMVFACLHLANNGITLLSFVNLFLAGVCLAQIYLLTKNIWMVALFHLGWNFFQGPILGFAVSGRPISSVFVQPAQQAANIINGGAFGLEGSVFDTALSVVAITALFLIRKSPLYKLQHQETRARNQDFL